MRLRCQSIHAGLHSHSACPDCQHTVENHTLDGLCDTCDIINHVAPKREWDAPCMARDVDHMDNTLYHCSEPAGHAGPHGARNASGNMIYQWSVTR